MTALGIKGAAVHGDVVAHLRKKAEGDVAAALSKARAEGVAARSEILEGDLAHAIVEYADKIDAGLIVTGSRGLSTLKRAFLGSVSMGIATLSKRPVLIVK